MSEADPFAIPTSDAQRILGITDSAVKRLHKLREMEGDPDLMLRVTVSGGGCSGFQYAFGFDDNITSDDLTFEKDGVVIVTDETSMDLLAGSQVDYVDDLMGAYFQVNNPNATASCGCGTSFAI